MSILRAVQDCQTPLGHALMAGSPKHRPWFCQLAKPVLMQVKIFRSEVTRAVFSLACLLHLIHVFKDKISPNEHLRCFDFIDPQVNFRKCYISVSRF